MVKVDGGIKRIDLGAVSFLVHPRNSKILDYLIELYYLKLKQCRYVDGRTGT